jgi:hypothetical protein
MLTTGGRIIFHTEDVDGLYSHFKNDASISELVRLKTPKGERFFHIGDPDGYQLSFAMPMPK